MTITKKASTAEEVYLKKNLWASKYASQLLKFEESYLSRENTFTIFLIDDDSVFLRALEHSINGVSVHKHIVIKCFSTGEDCIPYLEMRPSLIFLDYFLNESREDAMNGLEVLKKINELSPNTKVVMLSAQNDVTIVLKSIRLNVYGYIIKDKNAFIAAKKMIKKIIYEATFKETQLKDKRKNLTVNLILIITLLILFFLSRWWS